MRLVDADSVYSALHEMGGCHATDEWAKGYDEAIDAAIELLNDIPIIEAEDVKHGTWTNDAGNGHKTKSVRCTLCGYYTIFRSNYCPNCGAKMDGGNENET